jgi:integrase
MARNRYPTVSKGADGLWHAYVTVGAKGNGRPDQRHVKRATRAEVEDRVDELLDQQRAGAVVKPGRGTTVEQWLTTYLDTVAPRRCDPSTVYDYRSKLRNWVFPVIGGTRVDRLKPDQLDDVYLRMARAGKADSSILKTHRILSRALEIAYRRGLVPRNVAKLIDAPTSKRVEITPLTEAEAIAVLDAAAAGRRRNVARWSVGLALGLRQGEALGLRWPYVDLDAGEIRVWWQLHRRSFEHGCGGTCGKRRGGNCPARVLPLRSGEQVVHGGLILKEPKGKSKRTIPIPAELVAALVAHKEVQGWSSSSRVGRTRGTGSCSRTRTAARWTRATTSTTGRACSPRRGSGMRGCTTAAHGGDAAAGPGRARGGRAGAAGPFGHPGHAGLLARGVGDGPGGYGRYGRGAAPEAQYALTYTLDLHGDHEEGPVTLA